MNVVFSKSSITKCVCGRLGALSFNPYWFKHFINFLYIVACKAFSQLPCCFFRDQLPTVLRIVENITLALGRTTTENQQFKFEHYSQKTGKYKF